MSVPDITWVLAVMMFAAFVQSLGGFGFALLAVPLAALAVDLRIAVISVSIGSLFNTSILFLRTRQHIDRDLARRFNIPALLGMPIGLAVLAYVDERLLKTALGAIIIVATLALMHGVSNLRPRRSLELFAGWTAGILSTATGTNGPPLVLVSQMRGMTPEAFRATLAFTFTVSGTVSLCLFALGGLVTRPAMWLALAAVPLILLGQRMGLIVQSHVVGARFDRLVYGLLLLSGLSVGLSGVLTG